MKKHIIIQGKRGAGKNYIARAIALTHKKDRVLQVTAKELRRIYRQKIKYAEVGFFYDIVIIDECTQYLILDLLFMAKYFTSKKNNITGEVLESDMTFVFLTQTESSIPKEGAGFSNFHIIYCNNNS